jgi:hypothetical protein
LITKTWEHGPLKVVGQYYSEDDDAGLDFAPKVEIYAKGVKVASVRVQDTVGAPRVYFAEMDSSNQLPEVVVETFTGGAHCCTDIRVARAPAGAQGKWRVIDFGQHDGGFVEPRDIDGDGLAEFLLSDDRFLYAYGCYACGYAPPRILGLRKGKMADITRQPSFRPFLKREEKRALGLVKTALREGDSPNGYLAGYVALELLLGKGVKGWKYMLRHYAREKIPYCPLPDENGVDCPVPELRISFPLHLALFLSELGYVGERKL